jgi:hypothetical protein
MKEIHIYDFDATLFRSPKAPAWYDNDRDGEWHQNPFSFAEPCLPRGEQWVKPVLADAKRSIASKDVYAVVCTGRKKHFQKVVERLLAKKGLKFDEVILKDQGGTEAFKKRVIDELMSDFPNAVVHIWEDRHHHLKSFMAHIERNGGIGVPHPVPDNYSIAECSEEEFRSMRRSASETLKNLEMRVARLEKQSARTHTKYRLKFHSSMKELLMRLNEHEMNVLDGEERPANEGSTELISFEEVVRLLNKGGRDGENLTAEEIKALDKYAANTQAYYF